MSARTPREMAQEIVWQWMTTSLDYFTRSCIDDRGATLIEAIATALATAEATGAALADLYVFHPDCADCDESRDQAGDSDAECDKHERERGRLYESVREPIKAALQRRVARKGAA